ncbi:MAG: cytochrome P450 [Deltaproteobacteria bacterium]|nr:cytochrome P450 [Deltaproteobacteria bacterium]
MDPIPATSLLHLEHFAAGTPRAEIAQLRRAHRLLWQSDGYARGGHWLVFQRDDIDFVLKHPDRFTNAHGPLVEDTPDAILAELKQSMTFQDPPAHRTLRSLGDLAFKPESLAARRPLMQTMAREILDALGDRRECEFVGEVAMQLPMRILFRLLGVREEDHARVVDLTNTLTLANDPDFAENRLAGFQAGIDLIAFGETLAADLRREPRDSLSTAMLEAERGGRRLSDREFGRLFQNLVVGGVETTRNTLGWLLYELIRHPEQYARLQADPGLVEGAVEEVLRYRNTVVYLRRTATRDQEFAGEKLRAGDKLVCLLASVNRDERYFDEPDRFDIGRDPGHNRRNARTFGHGPHFCIGHQQARMNLEVMTAEIASRWSNPRLLAEPVHFRSNFMDGFKSMRVGFDPVGRGIR